MREFLFIFIAVQCIHYFPNSVLVHRFREEEEEEEEFNPLLSVSFSKLLW